MKKFSGNSNLAEQAYLFLCNNMDTHITINSLALHFNTSSSTLKKTFRDAYGDSIFSCIRRQKTMSAAKILKDTNKTILEIAGDYGYENGSKFSAAFKKVMGVSPSEYRKV